MPQIRHSTVTLTTALVLVIGADARAQQPAPPTPPVIDAAAISTLDRMGQYLRTLRVFRVSGAIMTEQVLADGQKVSHEHEVNLLAVRPNKMRVDIVSDLTRRVLLYDSATFTVWAPLLKYYATIPAPPTINELLDTLETKYDLEVPLVDLFRWGTDPAQQAAITAAKDLGPGLIDGVTCQHYAFRQEGLDWQVWIQNGDYPLPRRLIITTTSDDARPQHTATYTWDLAPAFNEEAFFFSAPKDAKQIPMLEARAMRPGNQEGETRK